MSVENGTLATIVAFLTTPSLLGFRLITEKTQQLTQKLVSK